MSKDLSLMIAGDVFVDHEDPWIAFEQIAPILQSADVLYGNCEGIYADPENIHLAPNRLVYGGAAPSSASRYGDAGFDVMGVTSNHMLDGGYEALDQTMEVLRSQGIKTVGAGQSADEATAPVIVERDGVKVAFLAFCSVMPHGWEAGESRPGISAFRLETFYRNPMPTFWDPGIEPEVFVVPIAEDLERLKTSLKLAREQADYVVASFHWGSHPVIRTALVPKARSHTKHYPIEGFLEEYEIEWARWAADNGADVVACGHHAEMRGIEIHDGTPIFYGMGALVHHFQRGKEAEKSDNPIIHDSAQHEAVENYAEEGIELEYPIWWLPTKLCGVATIKLSSEGALDVGFVPMWVMPDGSTVPLEPGDPRVEEGRSYMQAHSDEFGTELVAEERDGHAWFRVKS